MCSRGPCFFHYDTGLFILNSNEKEVFPEMEPSVRCLLLVYRYSWITHYYQLLQKKKKTTILQYLYICHLKH